MVSSDDMVNWTYHGVINVKALAPWGMASWAPSMLRARRPTANPLLSVLLQQRFRCRYADRHFPVGPWTDPLGKCVVDGNTPGLGKCKAPFDPGVVIDDKGIGWLSFGGATATTTFPETHASCGWQMT